MNNLKNVLEKIYKLNENSIKLGLDNIFHAVSLLNLEDKLDKITFIHIAGTNGKGSTASMLNTLLCKLTDKKIGLYTSPHLLIFNERIKINGINICDNEIIKIAEKIFKTCSNIKLTFFEFTTLICFLYFIENKVDIAVIETGLGGRLDATNIIKSKISIITSIAYDHSEYLGDTLEKIAFEKAGIIKENNILILANTSQNKAIKNIAAKKCIKKIYELTNNLNYKINENKTFDLFVENKIVFKNTLLNLKGAHQYSNASLALTALNILFPEIKNINDVLENVTWPARLEVLNIKSKLTKLYLDVSHNAEGVSATVSYFQKNYPKDKIIVACGFMKDKDYKTMVETYLNISAKILLFPTKIRGRELNFSDYSNTFLDNNNIFIYKSIEEAINNLLNSDGIGLISGSIYNVERVHKILKDDFNYTYTF